MNSNQNSNEKIKVQEKDILTRRSFMSRGIRSLAAMAVVSYFGYYLYDSEGPSFSQEHKLVQIPDFSLPDIHKMAIIKGTDRIKSVRRAFHALGGMESFVQKNDRVMLKVNAAFASPPLLCATTHPDLISEVIRLCLQAGAASVVVTDNPINDPVTCFAMTGIADATISAGGQVIVPKETFFYPTSVAGGHLIQNWPLLYEPFHGITKLIGIAPVKDHYRSGASLSMKNWYGLLGGKRSVFHQDIHNTIKELAMMVRPTLVILDGTTSMITNGPTGGATSDLKQTNTLVVSTDQVAADAFACSLLEKSITDLPYIAKVESQGIGTANYESLQPVRLETEN